MTIARALKITAAGAVAEMADADAFPFVSLGSLRRNFFGNGSMGLEGWQNHNGCYAVGGGDNSTLRFDERAPDAGAIVFVKNDSGDIGDPGANETTIQFSTGAPVVLGGGISGIVFGTGTGLLLIPLYPY